MSGYKITKGTWLISWKIDVNGKATIITVRDTTGKGRENKTLTFYIGKWRLNGNGSKIPSGWKGWLIPFSFHIDPPLFLFLLFHVRFSKRLIYEICSSGPFATSPPETTSKGKKRIHCHSIVKIIKTPKIRPNCSIYLTLPIGNAKP